MNTKHTTSSRWKKRILLISLMLVTGAGAVGVSRMGGDKPADKQKTVAKKGDEKPALESGKPGAKNEGGSAGAGGGVVMVASAGGAGPANESHGDRRDGASGGASKTSFDDSVFDMDGPNAPSAGVPGGSDTDTRKPGGSFEKVAGGGFGGGKDVAGGGGNGGASDAKGGPGNPGSSHGGPGGNYPTLAGGPGAGGKNPQDSAPIATPVPEPETYAMLLMGLGAVGWVAKRRGKRSN